MKFFRELKRRNVIRVGIAYVLIAWVALQGMDFLFDVIGAPDWVIQALLVVAMVGLPVVLVFAWVFEMTPEGIRRERDVPLETSITAHTGRRLDRTIIVLLGLVVAWFLFDDFYLERRPAPGPETAAQSGPATGEAAPASADEKPSVAVLPFVNMSNDAENEYFSDGLTETLLHMLAQLPELQVAARTSSFAFKGQSRSVAEIAAVLGVAHILEGSVQKAGDRVRITAQLVRADDGFHVWSQNYTRPLEDIFSIQDEIATDVARALDASLLGTGRGRIEPVHTSDLTAYDYWLKGLEEQAKFSYSSLPLAENHFKQALARDPGFTDAHISLARNYLLEFNTGLINEAEMEAAVLPLLDIIRSHDPNEPMVRALELAMQLMSWQIGFDLEERQAMVDELRALLAQVPTETFIRIGLAKTLQDVFHDYDEAEQVLRAGLMIDPLAANLYGHLGEVYSLDKRFDEARTALLRSLELEPEDPNTYSNLSGLARDLNDLPQAIEWLRRATEVDPRDHEFAGQLARVLYRLRLPEEGDRWRARVKALAPGSIWALHTDFMAAMVRDEDEAAIEAAQRMIRERMQERHGAFFLTVSEYGSLMSRLGRAREAVGFIASVRPDAVDFDRLADDMEGMTLQWVVVYLMADFEPPEVCREAWTQLTAHMDALGFPWRDPDGYGATMDLLFKGEVEKAAEAYVEGPLSVPLAWILDLVMEPWKRLMGPVYADPRVAARQVELEREYQQVRAAVREMLQQPEWSP